MQRSRASVVIGAALVLGCGAPERVSLGTGVSAASADAGPDGGRVLAFFLADVATKVDLRQLADGDSIDTSGAPVTIRAEVEPFDPGSVVFSVDGLTVRIEEDPPWVVSGDSPVTGEYYDWTISVGTHRVRATPYSDLGGRGVPGVALEQTFLIQ